MFNEPYFLYQTVPVWVAALLALALLLFSGRVAEMRSMRGADPMVWLSKGFLFALVALLAFFPALLVETPGAEINFGLLFYILFFSGFCYHVGRSSGWRTGRRHLGDMLGMESPEHMEDTQDRLFESRLRYPSRADVVKSIGELAKAHPGEDDSGAGAGTAGEANAKRSPTAPVDLSEQSALSSDPELAKLEAFFATKKDKRQ